MQMWGRNIPEGWRLQNLSDLGLSEKGDIMIIKKYGQVTVTPENIMVSYFEVDGNNLITFQRLAMEWAVYRLEEEIAKLESEFQNLSKYIGKIGDNSEDYAP